MRVIATICSAAVTAILLFANQAHAIPLTDNSNGPGFGSFSGADSIGGTRPVDPGIPDAAGAQNASSYASAPHVGLNRQLEDGQNYLDVGRPVPAIGIVTDTTWDSTAAVPEPGVLALTGLGLLGLVASRRCARAAPQR
jgi:hypothetical protein